MLSFMDGFIGYIQIKMDPYEVERIAFETPIGNFHYTVMLFGLKIIGAFYQCAMAVIFPDMLIMKSRKVDDIIIKSHKVSQHK